MIVGGIFLGLWLLYFGAIAVMVLISVVKR